MYLKYAKQYCKTIKILGLFLRAKFVPTHQYERISKSSAQPKKQYLSNLWLQSCLLIQLLQIHTTLYRKCKQTNYEAQLILREI